MKQFEFWKKEELSLLEENINKTNKELYELFKESCFNRSIDSIKRKKKKILEKKFNKVAKNNSEELKNIFTPLKTEEININYKMQKRDSTNKSKIEYETTLIVGDCHISPDQNIDRFIALGNFARERKPNNIVFMGDLGNFDSLSSFDAGKEASHGKRYKDEIKACRQALRVFKTQLGISYSPRLVLLGGNHDEARIERYIETHAQLRGHLNFEEDMRLDELGFEYIPYKKFLEIKGTLLSHAIMTAANSPASGKGLMHTIASLTAKSVIVGHHHRFETMSNARHGSDDLQQILLSGLFSETTEAYAEDGLNSYSRCIIMITHLNDRGKFDIEQISLERLKDQYL